MSISTNQINGTQLTQFIVAAVSGGVFSGVLGGFIAGGGYFGSGLVDTTGSPQLILGTKTFATSPNVQYSGANTGASASQKWVTDSVLYYVNSLSGAVTGGYVLINGNQTINDYKVFTGALGVGTASLGIHAATLSQLSGASGILAAAGAAAVSGALNTTIANTGQSAWISANGAANTLSGLLTNTGATLLALNSTLSGFVTGVSGALQAQISAGGATVSQLNSLSGFTTGISGALQVLINAGGGGGANGSGIFVQLTGDQLVSGVKTYTGMVIVGTPTVLGGAVNVSGLSGASGSLVAQIATTGQAAWNSANGAAGTLSGNLTTTGQTLYQIVTNASGQFNTNFATVTNLALSGSNLYNILTGESGSLTTRDLNISGALQAQIAGAVGTQVQVTGGGTMGFANLSGAGSVTVFSLGSLVTISGNSAAGGVSQGQLDALSGVVGTSGSQLYVIVTGLSGQVNTNFATITTTNTITTNLGSTGSVLYVDLTGMSGQSVTDYSTKTNLALTGSNLYIIVTGLSGQDVTNYATKTQLTNSGVTLGGQITSLSGFTVAASGALQTQIAAGGSQVRVSGSSNIAIADFTGIGGVNVFTSGSQVFISGGAGGTAGTTTLTRWAALDNSPPATAYATFDTTNNIPVLNFDAITGESGIFSNIMPQGASFANGIDARIFFRAAGGTTGAVVWNFAFESGNSNISTDAWTTGINSTGAPANGTLGIQTVATITFNSGQIGGLGAGDFFRARLSRVALDAADTMTGDAQFTALEIRQR